jgi:ketosteroid isomerase-like protein
MMKRLTVTLLTMTLSAAMLLAQPQTKATEAKKTAAPANAASDELKQIENDWVDASKAKNAEKLGEILADSWVALDWDGKTTNKAKALADLKTPGNSLDSIEMGPMKVRIFGNTAVVTGSDTEKSMEDGKDSSGKYIWTDVFVKQNGQWRAVASQSTKVPK